MKHLLITWTDIFYAIGDFFEWIFKGMSVLGQGPNVLISLGVIGLLAYWTIRLMRYKKEAAGDTTAE